MGKTGRAIVRALVAGERDAAVLARLRDPRVKADEATVARSLQGHWQRDEHPFAPAQALERHDFPARQIERCEERIMVTMSAHGGDDAEEQGTPRMSRERTLRLALRVVLRAVFGVDLTAISTIGFETALTMASGIGAGLSRFPSAQHFCSWLTLAPGTRISGGKAVKGRAAKRANHAGQALRMAATNARHDQTFIGACHRARLRRLDSGRAVNSAQSSESDQPFHTQRDRRFHGKVITCRSEATRVPDYESW